MHQLKHTSVLGSPIENGWSQIVVSSNQRLFCTIATKGNNAKNIGFELAQLIETHSQFSPSSIHNLLLDLLKQARDQEVLIQLAFLCFTDFSDKNDSPKVILAAYQGKILLKRAEKIGALLEADSELKLIEGSIKQNDQFLLATAQTEQLEQSIRQILKDDHSLDSFSSNLEPRVKMLVDSSLFALLLIKINELETPSTTQLIVNKHETILENLSNSEKQLNKKQIIDEIPEASNEPTIVKLETKIQNDDKSSLIDNKIDNSSLAENSDDLTIKISGDSLKKFFSGLIKNFQKWLISFYGLIKTGFQKIFIFLKKKLKKPSALQKVTDQQPSSFTYKEDAEKTATASSTRFSQVSNKFSDFKKINLFNRSSKNEFYLDEKKPINFRIILGVIFLLLTLGGVGLWIRAKILTNHQLAKESLIPAQELLIQAENLIDSDIIQARDKTSEAIELAMISQKDFEDSSFVSSIFSKFIDEARLRFQEIDGLIEVSQLEVFFDLSEKQPNFLTSVATGNSDVLFFVDSQQKQLLGLDISSKHAVNLPLDEVGSIKNITTSKDNVFILNSGIYQANFEYIQEGEEENAQQKLALTQLQLLKEEGDSDRGSTLLGFYENFLYVFNPEKRNIYRYIIRRNELSEPIGWLTNKQGIEFSKIFSMAIDGQIWLTTNEGNILRLERGQLIDFSVQGLDKEFKNPLIIYTNLDTEYLYLLESEENRVVVLSKEGKFIKQITSPTLASTTQLLVNEADNKAYAISGSIIYVIDL